MPFRAAANLLFAGVIMGVLWCTDHQISSQPMRHAAMKMKFGYVCSLGDQMVVPLGAMIGFGLALGVVGIDRLTKR